MHCALLRGWVDHHYICTSEKTVLLLWSSDVKQSTKYYDIYIYSEESSHNLTRTIIEIKIDQSSRFYRCRSFYEAVCSDQCINTAGLQFLQYNRERRRNYPALLHRTPRLSRSVHQNSFQQLSRLFSQSCYCKWFPLNPGYPRSCSVDLWIEFLIYTLLTDFCHFSTFAYFLIQILLYTVYSGWAALIKFTIILIILSKWNLCTCKFEN